MTASAVGARALEIATGCGGADVTLLHVVEFMPVEPLSDSLLPAMQIESELLETCPREAAWPSPARCERLAPRLAGHLGQRQGGNRAGGAGGCVRPHRHRQP